MSHTATADPPAYLGTDVAVYRVQEYLGVDYIAEVLDVKATYLNAHKWLLPNWGASDLPGKRRWHLSTIRAWFAEMTPADRQDAWDKLPASAQKARKAKWGGRS